MAEQCQVTVWPTPDAYRECGQVLKSGACPVHGDPRDNVIAEDALDQPRPRYWRAMKTHHGWPGVVGSHTPGGEPVLRIGLGDTLPDASPETAAWLAEVLNEGILAVGLCPLCGETLGSGPGMSGVRCTKCPYSFCH